MSIIDRNELDNAAESIWHKYTPHIVGLGCFMLGLLIGVVVW